MIASSSSPFDAIVHIVNIAIIVWIIHTIRLSSFRDGATTKMAGHQPDVPPRPVAVPIHVEDSLVIQAIATAPAIGPTITDAHRPRRQWQFCDLPSRCHQEAVHPVDTVVSGATDPDDPRHASLNLELGSVELEADVIAEVMECSSVECWKWKDLRNSLSRRLWYKFYLLALPYAENQQFLCQNLWKFSPTSRPHLAQKFSIVIVTRAVVTPKVHTADIPGDLRRHVNKSARVLCIVHANIIKWFQNGDMT